MIVETSPANANRSAVLAELFREIEAQLTIPGRQEDLILRQHRHLYHVVQEAEAHQFGCIAARPLFLELSSIAISDPAAGRAGSVEGEPPAWIVGVPRQATGF